MQTIIKAGILFGIGAAFSLLSGGCATGPEYEYVEQKDSASVEGAIAPIQDTTDYGKCSIQIVQIDRLTANYQASSPGFNWSFAVPGHPLYLAPGRHALTLDIAEVDEVIGETGRGDVGTVGVFASGSKPTLTAEFTANHIYRLTANLEGSSIDVILWDETGGAAARSRVANWTLDSNGNYSENIPPVHNR